MIPVDRATLSSASFGFMAECDQILGRYDALAEHYFALEPRDCVAKLRQIAEHMAQLTATEAEKKNKKKKPSSRRLSVKKNREDGKSAKVTTANDPPQTVLHFLQSNPGLHSKTDILNDTNLDPATWPTLTPRLTNHHQIHRTGQKRGTRYQWQGKEGV